MITLLLSTSNKHKIQEIRSILGGAYAYLTLEDFPSAPAAVEDGKTFAANAKKKATGLASWLAKNPDLILEKVGRKEFLFCVLADDSGLEVDALNGAPGVYSARFAAMDSKAPGNSPDLDNNVKLLGLLKSIPLEKRTARFRCVLALTQIPFAELTKKPLVLTVDGLGKYTAIFDGACEGRITLEGGGKGGFGYDPLFIPNGYDKSFGELGEDVKNKLSHRAKALEKLRVSLAAEQVNLTADGDR